MQKAIKRITADSLKSGLPGYDLLDRVIDAFAARERIKAIVSSPDYQELNVLWGCITWTKGTRTEVLIEGGPRFCEAALRALEEHAGGIEVITPHLRPRIPWHRRLFGTGE